MSQSATYFCGLAAMLYLAVCLTLAAVRWFHMCRPYDRDARYYYPGRPFVTGVWLSALATVPYVLHPESVDAWCLARLYFLPVTMFHFAIIAFSYFGSVMQWRRWRALALLVGMPVALALLAAVGLSVWPGEQLAASPLRTAATWVYVALGVVVTITCVALMCVVLRWAKRFDNDDFSNPADFPVVQARRWILMIVVNMGLCWAGAALDSPAFLAALQLLLAVSCVVFLITALQPHRNGPVEVAVVTEPLAEAQEVDLPEQPEVRSEPSGVRPEELLSAVVTVVEEQEAYRDSHLTLQDVANRCGYGRTYIAAVVKSELGGFFSYVNHLRVEYAERYLNEHPEATIAEAAEAAGFSDRKAFYKARGHVVV